LSLAQKIFMNPDSPLSEANLPITIQQFQAEVTFKKVRDLLTQRNIEVILLKGPHLGSTVYESPKDRLYGDLDILVKPDNFEQAAALLLENGFKPFAYDSFTPEIQRDFKHWEFRSPWGVLVELHRWLSGHDRYPIDSEKIFKRAVCFHFGDVECQGLASEDLLLHLCLHMGTSYFYAIERKHVLDVALLIRKMPVDWPTFLERIKRVGAGAIAYYSLMAARLQEGAIVPINVLDDLRPFKLRRLWLERNIDPTSFPIYIFTDHSLKRIKRRLLFPLLDRPGQWVCCLWRITVTRFSLICRSASRDRVPSPDGEAKGKD
jgi:hypothetical protein